MYTGRVPNDPLYQPQGASHFGGLFADTVCVCSAAGDSCKCAQVKAAAPAQEPAKAPPAQAPPALGVQVGGCGLPSAPLSHEYFGYLRQSDSSWRTCGLIVLPSTLSVQNSAPNVMLGMYSDSYTIYLHNSSRSCLILGL